MHKAILTSEEYHSPEYYEAQDKYCEAEIAVSRKKRNSKKARKALINKRLEFKAMWYRNR